MKIKPTFNKNQISDELSINGNVLKVNGKDFDTENLLSPSTEENADNTQFFIDNPCYIENDIKHLKIYVDSKHWFLFINNNYLLFHDKDLNGEIDLDELKGLIDCYNLPEADRVKEHKDYIKTFTVDDWIARRKSCGQLKDK